MGIDFFPLTFSSSLLGLLKYFRCLTGMTLKKSQVSKKLVKREVLCQNLLPSGPCQTVSSPWASFTKIKVVRPANPTPGVNPDLCQILRLRSISLKGVTLICKQNSTPRTFGVNVKQFLMLLMRISLLTCTITWNCTICYVKEKIVPCPSNLPPRIFKKTYVYILCLKESYIWTCASVHLILF